ncbi:hypothetical protein RGQ13_11190 [Thalassotalea psychrophila]|uniref:Lipoprotein n=1 Tax=Thalassotalea psychrophila TaxID=3065647 RepID=A0ABY9TPE6_9GAMM|nr:hypothetical protein RGQ13_11190 [Colwelliaceae bacterium SQ149]
MRNFIVLLITVAVYGCVVLPVKDEGHTQRCYISSDKKTLKVVNLNGEGSGNYYSISGILVSPITMLASGVVSGAYVLTNNTYHLGEEKLVCG